MNTQTITIDKKKYRIMPESEFVSLKQDIADLKKVFARRKETGIEANTFFKELEKKGKTKK